MTLLFAISLGGLKSIGIGLLGLGVVIFVHELGHFLVAKLCGVKCEKFYVGFDPPMKIGPIRIPSALFRKKIGETEYGIGVIPLGGYVKMLGQDDNPANAAKEAERIRLARENNPDGEAEDEPEFQIDPRSYPAKPVWQRLLIISAGVVMNLIFAVIFGALAYRAGVGFTPCIIGSTTPGLSGWQVDLRPGDRIVQIGRNGKRSDQLRFIHDLRQNVALAGAGNDIDLLVQRYGESDPEWITVHLKPYDGLAYIGVAPIESNQIGALFGNKAKERNKLPYENALLAGDKIVEVNGQTVDEKDGVIIAQAFADADLPVELEVERTNESKKTESLSITVDPEPMRWLGFGMKMGPIVEIQEGSPAESVGLQIGDQITAINGEPTENGMVVPQLLRRLGGEAVTIDVLRKNDEGETALTVNPVLRTDAPAHLQENTISGWLAAETLGIAFPVLPEVASVSDAAKDDIQVNDRITKVEFIYSSKKNEQLEKNTTIHFRSLNDIDLQSDKYKDFWPIFQAQIQQALPDTKVKLTYERNNKEKTVTLEPIVSEEWFVENRGIFLNSDQEIHQVDNWGNAFALGYRETKENLFVVVGILKRLFTGQLSVTKLSGPLGIITMAGSEASAGLTRLLIFLTMLSANLAVLNFLPIPVLDGGHAVFLIYEGIFRKPLDERLAFGLTLLGFCFILTLFVMVMGMDIFRIAKWAF